MRGIDEVTGLYYLQIRYYNPDTGRFLTRDSFDGIENELLSLNKYSYSHNNPVMNTNHQLCCSRYSWVYNSSRDFGRSCIFWELRL